VHLLVLLLYIICLFVWGLKVTNAKFCNVQHPNIATYSAVAFFLEFKTNNFLKQKNVFRDEATFDVSELNKLTDIPLEYWWATSRLTGTEGTRYSHKFNVFYALVKSNVCDFSPTSCDSCRVVRHFFFSNGLTALRGPRLVIVRRFTITLIDTPRSVGLLWTSDQPVAETSTWQHTTLTRDRHPCPRRDSNPRP
jgi:hypothetical protein